MIAKQSEVMASSFALWVLSEYDIRAFDNFLNVQKHLTTFVYLLRSSTLLLLVVLRATMRCLLVDRVAQFHLLNGRTRCDVT